MLINVFKLIKTLNIHRENFRKVKINVSLTPLYKLVKLFNSKDWQETGCKQISTQKFSAQSTQQRILNERKFEFLTYTVAV